MFSFEPLEQLLQMDLTQLRANNGCATDEAIEFFIQRLNEFFDQFDSAGPSEKDKAEFKEVMQELIERINQVEVDYFREKFKRDYSDSQSPETIESMAQQTRLKNYEKLPTILQYWARRGEWGDAIHNPAAHSLAVKRIQAWSHQDKISARSAVGMFGRSNEGHEPEKPQASSLPGVSQSSKIR